MTASRAPKREAGTLRLRKFRALRGNAVVNMARLALAILGILLLVELAAAQPALDQSYDDSACGFRLSYPSGWQAERPSDKVIRLIDPDNTASFDVVAVGSENLWGPDPSNQLRLAGISSIAMYVVMQRKEALLWIDRFIERSVAFSYVLYRHPPANPRTPTQIGDETREHYVLVAGAASTRSNSWAVLGFWVLPERFRQLESVLMGMLRSFQFTGSEHTC